MFPVHLGSYPSRPVAFVAFPSKPFPFLTTYPEFVRHSSACDRSTITRGPVQAVAMSATQSVGRISGVREAATRRILIRNIFRTVFSLADGGMVYWLREGYRVDSSV